MIQIETFYVWKIDPRVDLGKSLKWHGLYDDTWFLYEESKGRVTKTNHFILIDLENDINRSYRSTKELRVRKQIITVSPKNIVSQKRIVDLNYGQSTDVDTLDFAGLLKKDVLYVKSHQDKDLSVAENLYLDISYKRIIGDLETSARDRRRYLGDLRRRTLTEYQDRFPDLEFRASVISYNTYNINPACSRSFEELYEDFEREQDAAKYGNYLDNLHGY